MNIFNGRTFYNLKRSQFSSLLWYNVLTNVLKTFDMSFTTWKEIENFSEVDSSSWSNLCKISWINYHLVFYLILFYNCNVVTRLLQSENVLQSIINLFINFAPISWYNDILGCKPPLIENLNYKFFSKDQPWYIKVPHVSKIVKLWWFFVYTVMCFHPMVPFCMAQMAYAKVALGVDMD
jgi:hypothetical protein